MNCTVKKKRPVDATIPLKYSNDKKGINTMANHYIAKIALKIARSKYCDVIPYRIYGFIIENLKKSIRRKDKRLCDKIYKRRRAEKLYSEIERMWEIDKWLDIAVDAML